MNEQQTTMTELIAKALAKHPDSLEVLGDRLASDDLVDQHGDDVASEERGDDR